MAIIEHTMDDIECPCGNEPDWFGFTWDDNAETDTCNRCGRVFRRVS